MGDPIICAACGHANRAAARFCEQCGAPLSVPCAGCGNELRAGASFCDACGMPAMTNASPATAPGGEARKVLTVLFADLVGSTALQEQLDAESARRVMTRFYERMRSVIEAHGGSIQKFIGDAVVAAFGIPELREDDALRAVRAAAAMVSALGELGDELELRWGVRLRMRTAVNTGELVVSEQGVLVGDTMNTAARLEQAAAAGEVLVGESTWRLVHHAAELEAVAQLELKGKALPVRAWRLVSVAAADPRRTAAVEVPLVGRADELARLNAAFEGVLRTRECRLVTVTGSPGVGKTRLAVEFERLVSDVASVVEGRCEPTGQGITFLPVAEVLRVVADIGEADAAEVVRAKLGTLMPEDDPDRQRMVDRVAAILGFGEPASAEETFWALRRGLESQARARPLVLVLDDLHWGQPMLLDLVEHLVEWVRDAPMLIVALARPELREAREALAFVGRRATDVIELESLDAGESQELVSGLLGDMRVPSGLSTRILATTEGNPLFLGETVRMLVDEGVLRREGDAWVVGDDVAAIEVPPTIQALLAARIERLQAAERSVMERAAVIGKQFYRGAVAELVSPPVRSGIDGHLEALRRKDLVEPEGTYWIDEPVYRFHHVLIRDAAYRSLLKEARAELHERFADWLEVKAGELVGEHEEVIAFHLEQAHEYRRQLGPLGERGRALGSRAAERLHSAGRRALLREDLAAATNLLGRALAREGEEQHEIAWDLCEAVLSAGDTSTAAGLLERFAGAGVDDPGRLARRTILLGQLANLTGAGQVSETAQSVSAAAATLGGIGDRLGEAKGYHVAAGAYARLGQVAAVEDALDRALAGARAAGDRRRTTAVLAGAPRAALWGPSPVVRASGRCLDVVRILRMTPGNRHVEAIALRCQAVLEAMRGRPPAAREILGSGRATLEELGLTLELHETAVHAGIVELLSGDPLSAESHLRAARDGFEALGVAAGAAQAAALLARALVEQGGHDQEALEQTRFAEQYAGEDLKTTIIWCSARAEALAHMGDLEEGLALARSAMSLAEPTDALADKADAAMALARVLLAVGDGGAAREAARAARACYDAKGHVVGAERAAELAGGVVAVPEPASGITGAPTKPVVELGDRPPGELGGTRAARLGERTSERLMAEFVDRYNAHDLDAMIGLYREDFVMTDHRNVGWGVVSGLDEFRQSLSSGLAMSEDMHFVLHEVIACDERVIALRVAWVGTATDGGGQAELPVGMVTANDGERTLTTDIFEYDDRQALVARYAELGGGLSALGDRPPERYLAAFVDAHAARDIEALGAVTASDFEFVDHRPLGWEAYGFRGADPAVRAGWEATEFIHLVVDEVLACDDRVIAARTTWHGSMRDGGGRFEIPVGLVAVIESGRAASWDQYEPDDREAMLARFAELAGRPSAVLGDRPPERWSAEFLRDYAAHDIERVLERYAEEFVLVDHRAVGWDRVHGRDELRELYESVFKAAPSIRAEIDEVLACDERVIATRMAFRGEGRLAGEFEDPMAHVTTVENGRCVRVDIYDYHDDAAILRRYHELGGYPVALGRRAPERHMAGVVRRQATGDLDGLMELYAEDVVLRDHRTLPWEDTYGRQELKRVYQAYFGTLPDLWMDVDEVLACDDRVIAQRYTLRAHAADGGGETSLSIGSVNVFEAGRWTSLDLYEPDDRERMLARYAELTDVAHARIARLFMEAFNAGDWDALAELYADDCAFVDHRPVGWGRFEGVGGLIARSRSLLEMVSDHSGHGEILDDETDEVFTLRQRHAGIWQGAPWEIALDTLTELRAGRIARVELFNLDQSELRQARRAELRAGRGTPPTGWAAPFAAYPTVTDRRPDGLGVLIGSDAISARFGLSLTGEALAATAEAVLLRLDPDSFAVAALNHAAEAGSVELFGEEDAARARYAELTEDPEAVASIRFGSKWFDALNRRDRIAARACLVDDLVVVDHRLASGIAVRGAEGYLDLLWSLMELSDDIRWYYTDWAQPAAIAHCSIAISGHWNAGGGEAEIPVGVVFRLAELSAPGTGRFQLIELYPPEAVDEMNTRVEELIAEG